MEMKCLMEMRKVTAVIRSSKLENVEARMQEIGVHGCSVTTVKGYGEYADFYARDHMTKHTRIEVFTEKDKAEDIAQAIIKAAYVGQPGDGMVAILPVEKFYHIRAQSEAKPDEAC